MRQKMDIVTLLPSATEHVAALGYANSIVGCSHECDYPSSVRSAKALTVPRIDSSLPSAELDRSVREALREVLTVYELDVEGLEELAPDIIVTQDLCDVCAVDFDDVQRAVEALGLDAEIVRLHPTKLGDITRDLMDIAAVIGDIQAGERVVADMEERYRAIRAAVAPRRSTPRVLTIEWIDPVMVGGTWMPEMVEMCGGLPLVTSPGDHAPTLEREALKELDPEVVLVKPCGFDLARTRQELSTVVDLVDSMPWTACDEGAVFIADGNAYFNRSGPRIVDSAEILAACIHPELCADYGEKYSDDFVRLSEWR